MGTVEHVGFPQVSGMIESLDGANRFLVKQSNPSEGRDGVIEGLGTVLRYIPLTLVCLLY